MANAQRCGLNDKRQNRDRVEVGQRWKAESISPQWWSQNSHFRKRPQRIYQTYQRMKNFKVVAVGQQAAAYVPIIDENTLNLIADKVAERLAKLIEPDTEPKYYNRNEVAAILHVSLPTIDRMMQDGRLTAKRVGRRVLFDAQTIDEAVKEKTIFKLKSKRC